MIVSEAALGMVSTRLVLSASSRKYGPAGRLSAQLWVASSWKDSLTAWPDVLIANCS